MAKKRRKKSGKGPIAALVLLISNSFQIFLKALPSLAVILILGAAFLGVREALYADSNLGVQKIVVDPPQALSIAARQELESKFIGRNILKINLRQIAAKLEKDPEIESARVGRRLPSFLKIEIKHRDAVGLIQFLPHGNYGLISEDGMILDTFRERKPSMVVIEAFGTGEKDAVVGMKVDHAGFSEAAHFVKMFWNHKLAKQETIEKASYDHLGNVSIRLVGGPEIRLGRKPAGRFPALEKAMTLLVGEDRKKTDYVDLQFDNVIVKRKR